MHILYTSVYCCMLSAREKASPLKSLLSSLLRRSICSRKRERPSSSEIAMVRTMSSFELQICWCSTISALMGSLSSCVELPGTRSPAHELSNSSPCSPVVQHAEYAKLSSTSLANTKYALQLSHTYHHCANTDHPRGRVIIGCRKCEGNCFQLGYFYLQSLQLRS